MLESTLTAYILLVPYHLQEVAPLDSMVGFCGLYCGACYHYRASFPEGAHLVSRARPGMDKDDFYVRDVDQTSSIFMAGVPNVALGPVPKSRVMIIVVFAPIILVNVQKNFKEMGGYIIGIFSIILRS